MRLSKEAGFMCRTTHEKMDLQMLLLMMKSSWLLQVAQISFEMMPVDLIKTHEIDLLHFLSVMCMLPVMQVR